jgi:hypothetical protein
VEAVAWFRIVGKCFYHVMSLFFALPSLKNNLYYNFSAEHQKLDWPLHKPDCKAFRRAKVRAFFYMDDEILEKYPFSMPGFGENADADDFEGCVICGDTSKPMTLTECCNQPICDTESEYQMMSYSREYCNRSHKR